MAEYTRSEMASRHLEAMHDLDRRSLEAFAKDGATERIRTYRLVISGIRRLAAEHDHDARSNISPVLSDDSVFVDTSRSGCPENSVD